MTPAADATPPDRQPPSILAVVISAAALLGWAAGQAQATVCGRGCDFGQGPCKVLAEDADPLGPDGGVLKVWCFPRLARSGVPGCPFDDTTDCSDDPAPPPYNISEVS